MLRWFVTGAGGQLATALAPLLDGDVFLSREADLDIRDELAVRRAVRAFAPDIILHTAAYTDVDGAETHRETAEAINVVGTRNLVNALRETPVRLVYFSSDYVFDGTKGRPYVESDETNPLSVYGRTKRDGEREALSWPGGIVVRTAWLFSEMGTNFVRTILAAARSQAEAGLPLKVVDDQIGSPTYAGHLATAVVNALGHGVGPGIYHMAGSGYCSWYELACEVVRVAGIDIDVVPIASADLARPAPRPAFSALETERAIPRLPHWAAGVAAAVDGLLRREQGRHGEERQ